MKDAISVIRTGKTGETLLDSIVTFQDDGQTKRRKEQEPEGRTVSQEKGIILKSIR